MRRTALYSTSPSTPPKPGPEKPVEPRARIKWRDLYTRYERRATLVILLGVIALLGASYLKPVAPAISHEDVNAVVQRTLVEQPSPATKAYAAVQRAVVRVRAIGDGLEHDDYMQRSVGTGVVIVKNGTVLTSLHVVAGASRVKVLFAEGLESEAKIVGTVPENDLAVLKVDTLPDDLAAATMGSAKDLAPGETVVAVGFPFGIGPSVSAGVVSGLNREYRSPGGERLSNLIQFDAAVNPGSSGGPLVNAAGEVVGIVTAMLDPGGGGFAGIGFAVTMESAARAAGVPPL
jgi:S1-C subfamily serine protease